MYSTRRWSFFLSVLVMFTLLLSTGLVMAQDGAADSGSSGLVTALRHTHSLVRWLVIIVAIVALVKLVMGLVQKASYDALTKRIMVIFSGVITLQWVIGLVFLVVIGGITGFGLRHYWEHLVVMTIAVGLSHMHNSKRWRDAADHIRFRNSLIIIVVVLMLVFIGVSLLPQGWRIAPV